MDHISPSRSRLLPGSRELFVPNLIILNNASRLSFDSYSLGNNNNWNQNVTSSDGALERWDGDDDDKEYKDETIVEWTFWNYRHLSSGAWDADSMDGNFPVFWIAVKKSLTTIFVTSSSSHPSRRSTH